MKTSDGIKQVNEPDFNYPGLYTYADYLKWTIEDRLELIKGRVFKMSPAPNRSHQTLSGRIFAPLWNFLKHQKCSVYHAPFDVRLPRRSSSSGKEGKEDSDILTVVQPDICIVCDPGKLDDKGCIGAPDIIIEILSPGNNVRELRFKYDVYEESGVKEYWIIAPAEQTVLIYYLTNGKFQPSRLMTSGDVITTPILPGFKLDLVEVFE